MLTFKTIFISIIIVSLFGCNNNKQPQQFYKPSFTTFELSFSSGWGNSFSCFIDSNKIFLSPKSWDTCYYGIVPKRIMNRLDTLLLKMQTDSSFKTIDKSCYDCSDIAIKIITINDTIQMHQFGELNKEFYDLVDTLKQNFTNKDKRKINCWLGLETMYINSKIPPKIIKE